MTGSARPTFAENDFRKGSRSQPHECVYVARRDGWVQLRDNKNDPFGSDADVRLTFTEAEFDAYQEAVRRGDSTEGLCLVVIRREDGMYVFRSAVDQPDAERAELVFDQAEVDVFVAAIHDHEFDAAAFAAA